MLEFIKIPCKLYDSLYNRLLLRYKHVNCGRNLTIRGKLLLQGKGEVVLGDDVCIYSHYTVNPIGGHRTAFQVMKNGSLKIGNRVGISHAVIAAHKSVVIEDDVLIGADCRIFDTDFHALDFERRMEGREEHIKKAPVKIEKGVFIGAGSYILKGVTIGAYSIIGAGSVVAKSIPSGEIWAGNPAVFIRKIEG